VLTKGEETLGAGGKVRVVRSVGMVEKSVVMQRDSRISSKERTKERKIYDEKSKKQVKACNRNRDPVSRSVSNIEEKKTMKKGKRKKYKRKAGVKKGKKGEKGKD